ncbi:MAG: tyrosine-type recombinase/integrase [Bacteriovoracia bacterium]
MSQSFDPSQFNGRNLVYISVPNSPGICSIWDWNEKKSKYIRRTEGLQFFAYKRVRGMQRSKCFDTFAAAKRWRELDPLTVDENVPNARLFAEVKKDYFEWCKSRVEVTTYETYLSNAKHVAFFDRFAMSELTPKVVDKWLMFVKAPEYVRLQHRTRVSYKPELAILGYICRYYSEYEDDSFQIPIKARHHTDCIIDLAKYKQAQDRNRSHFIPRHEFERFLTEIARKGTEKSDYSIYSALAEFQLGTGCRVGEACAVDFSDILDWEKGMVKISKSVQWSRKKGRPTRISPITKTGESRTVFLSFRALAALKKWRIAIGRTEGLIFSKDGIEPIPYRCVQRQYDNVFKTLGLSWRSTHILRHSYSTDFLEKTRDKVALQGQLGHRSSKQTDHYAKITNSAQLDGVRTYNDRTKDSDESNVVEIGYKKAGGAV